MVYKTVQMAAQESFVEKKSKFIGHCKPVSCQEEAQAFIKEIKVKHWDASHNVWAYALRAGGIMRYSDDGEPQGTAGIPVLDVLRKSSTENAVVVVTRYFGGVLLGAGGLVRAYSHGASLALTAAKPVFMKECGVYTAHCDYSRYSKLQELIAEASGCIEDTVFAEAVTIQFYTLPQQIADFTVKFADLTGGQGVLTEIGRVFHGFPTN